MLSFDNFFWRRKISALPSENKVAGEKKLNIVICVHLKM
jgi:hypothetical protein